MKYICLFVLVIFGFSCDREYGCMDSTAANYNSKAELEDNTCYYQVTGMIYWNMNKCQFQDYGISSLNISINGKSIASNIDLDNFKPCSGNEAGYYNPSCGDSFYDFPRFNIMSYPPNAKNLLIEIYEQNQSLLKSFTESTSYGGSTSIGYVEWNSCKLIEFKF